MGGTKQLNTRWYQKTATDVCRLSVNGVGKAIAGPHWLHSWGSDHVNVHVCVPVSACLSICTSTRSQPIRYHLMRCDVTCGFPLGIICLYLHGPLLRDDAHTSRSVNNLLLSCVILYCTNAYYTILYYTIYYYIKHTITRYNITQYNITQYNIL